MATTLVVGTPSKATLTTTDEVYTLPLEARSLRITNRGAVALRWNYGAATDATNFETIAAAATATIPASPRQTGRSRELVASLRKVTIRTDSATASTEVTAQTTSV